MIPIWALQRVNLVLLLNFVQYLYLLVFLHAFAIIVQLSFNLHYIILFDGFSCTQGLQLRCCWCLSPILVLDLVDDEWIRFLRDLVEDCVSVVHYGASFLHWLCIVELFLVILMDKRLVLAVADRFADVDVRAVSERETTLRIPLGKLILVLVHDHDWLYQFIRLSFEVWSWVRRSLNMLRIYFGISLLSFIWFSWFLLLNLWHLELRLAEQVDQLFLQICWKPQEFDQVLFIIEVCAYSTNQHQLLPLGLSEIHVDVVLRHWRLALHLICCAPSMNVIWSFLQCTFLVRFHRLLIFLWIHRITGGARRLLLGNLDHI